MQPRACSPGASLDRRAWPSPQRPRRLHFAHNPPIERSAAVLMRESLNLTLFLRHMGSLRTWEDSGILSREMEMYRALQEHNVRVSIVSHGGRDERAFRDQLPGMMILSNWMGLPGPVYERRAHLIHARRCCCNRMS